MATKRLIDANAFQFEPDPYGGANGVLLLGRSNGKMMATTLLMLKKMVANAPTVDAVEVVHGRWIHDENVIRGLSEHQYVCSVCTHIYWNARIPNFKYCPNCGAKMDL